jgi:hypothetical protein
MGSVRAVIPRGWGGASDFHRRRHTSTVASRRKEIFYIAADRMLTAVELLATMKPGTPRPLFRVSIAASLLPITDRTLYGVTSDGQRFLVASRVQGAGPPAITVATNWPAFLRATLRAMAPRIAELGGPAQNGGRLTACWVAEPT